MLVTKLEVTVNHIVQSATTDRKSPNRLTQLMSTDLPPTDLGAAREVQARIYAHLPGLQAAEVRVARVVLEQPNVARAMRAAVLMS